jgi:cytochrome c oxidase assembly protein subunit 15
LIGLVTFQIYLGAQIIWTGRSVHMTTGHVIIGALTLATTFGVVFSTYRSSIERPRA